MTNADDNLNKEIEDGLAHAEKMLRRQRLQRGVFVVVGALVLVGVFLGGRLTATVPIPTPKLTVIVASTPTISNNSTTVPTIVSTITLNSINTTETPINLPSATTYSPGLGKLFFLHDGKADIYILDRNSATGPRSIRFPSFSSDTIISPDGHSVAINGRNNKGLDGITVYDIDTLEEKQVVKNLEGFQIYDFFWSTDGQSLSYVRSGPCQFNEINLISQEVNARGWNCAIYQNGIRLLSPNKKYFIFVDARDLWLIPTDGTGTKENLTRTGGVTSDYDEIAWSNDSQKVYFLMRTTPGAFPDLYETDVQTREKRIIASEIGNTNFISISPNNKLILFTKGSELQIVDMSSSSQVGFYHFDANTSQYQAQWSSDSTSIAITDDNKAIILDLNGRILQTIDLLTSTDYWSKLVWLP